MLYSKDMKVKIFYALPQAKNIAQTLFSHAMKKGLQAPEILYIVPTQEMIDERIMVLHNMLKGSYIQPEMLTLRQLSIRLYSLFGDKLRLPETLMPVIISAISGKGMGFASITAKFISEVRRSQTPEENGALTLRPEFFIKVFGDLAIPDVVLRRVLDSLKTFEGYKAVLEGSSAIDDIDALLIGTEIIKEKLSLNTLIIDGFYELTNAEKAVIQTLINKAEETLISIPISKNYTDISSDYIDFIKNNFKTEEVFFSLSESKGDMAYHPFPSLDEEVEAIARHIKAAFISGRQRNLDRLIVAFPELEQYRDTVNRVFRRYGIPHTVLSPRPFSRLRQFLDVMCLLESIADDYPRLSFSVFLFSSYFQKMPQALKAAVPGICSNSRIIKGKEQWLKAFSAEGDEVYKAAKKLFKTLGQMESMKDKASYADYLKALNNILNSLGFVVRTDSDAQPALDTRDIFKWIAVVNNIVGKDTDLRGFIDSLRHILEHSFDEVRGVGVQVMSMSDAAGIEPDYIYIGGLKDGSIPYLPEIDHLLPDSVRTKLGFMNFKRHLMKQEFLFERLTAFPARIYLTYPTMEGDKFFLPSLFLRDAKEKKERVSGVFSLEEELLRKKHRIPFSAHIRNIKGLKGAGRRFSKSSYIYVTNIDSYRRCPRRFFIEKILGLEPAEVKEYRPEPLIVGTIIHEVMEGLVSCGAEDYASFEKKAVSVLDEVLFGKPVDEYWKMIIKGSFLIILPEIYRLEESIRAEGYQLEAVEKKITGEPLKGIRLKGNIDRIDEKTLSSGGTVVELIDYKTGSSDLTSTQVLKNGASLQLFLYAALLKTSGKAPEKVGIYSLKNLNIKWFPNKRDVKEGRTLDDYLTASLRFLNETVKAMRQGDFPALPINEQICSKCHERPYCPYIQGIGD